MITANWWPLLLSRGVCAGRRWRTGTKTDRHDLEPKPIKIRSAGKGPVSSMSMRFLNFCVLHSSLLTLVFWSSVGGRRFNGFPFSGLFYYLNFD